MDLIDRQDALEAICTWDKFGVDGRGRVVWWHEGLEPYVHLRDVVWAIENMPSAQPEITLESAIDYLHSIGWMQEHDRIMAESAQPEIITCIDCIHYAPFRKDKAWGSCPVNQRMCQSCDFCAWAERIEEDG